jgi:4-hydroxy-2-oxoglutarate aldolase
MELSGVMPPVTTPFRPDGEVAYEELGRNLERWNRTALSGYVVAGSTGECVTLTEREKLRLWEVARKHIPAEKRFIAGTGLESTGETVALTGRAASIGAEAAMVVTPWYYKGAMRSRELVAHFTEVADASPIPVLLYSVPQFTGVVLEPDAVAALAEHPNVIGMKDSSEDMVRFSEYRRVTPDSFQLLVGSAQTFYLALSLGARGGVLALANVAPEACVAIHRLFMDGKYEDARRLQLGLMPLAHALGARFGIAAVKVAMSMRGYYGGPTRPPLLPLHPEEVEAVRREVVHAELD